MGFIGSRLVLQAVPVTLVRLELRVLGKLWSSEIEVKGLGLRV